MVKGLGRGTYGLGLEGPGLGLGLEGPGLGLGLGLEGPDLGLGLEGWGLGLGLEILALTTSLALSDEERLTSIVCVHRAKVENIEALCYRLWPDVRKR